MLRNDWFMRQVESMVEVMIRMLFHKDNPDYVIRQDESSVETNLLYARLVSLLEQGRINEAEDLLFEKMDTHNDRYLELALDFYARLNRFSDEELEQGGFSREEIGEGLKECAHAFGVTLI
jgi:hypothetical protein